jgi:lipopolysaccharide/colanic/teichoic acid biosynthesis glycosyltransferase
LLFTFSGWCKLLTSILNAMLKRLFDISLSGLGLVLSSPLWALIAIAIKLEDGGPIFYGQSRVGKDCREFQSIKFRSMVADSDARWGVVPAKEGDPRITRVGRMMRSTAMDELPQLWNIFRGDMSFVGPRPEWTELVKEFRREIPDVDRRHAVTPGLTGVAQIYGHSESPRRQKLRYDLLYINKGSFWLDLRLVFVSFLVTFTGKWEDRTAKVPKLIGGRRRSKSGTGPISKPEFPGVPITRS